MNRSGLLLRVCARVKYLLLCVWGCVCWGWGAVSVSTVNLNPCPLSLFLSLSLSLSFVDVYARVRRRPDCHDTHGYGPIPSPQLQLESDRPAPRVRQPYTAASRRPCLLPEGPVNHTQSHRTSYRQVNSLLSQFFFFVRQHHAASILVAASIVLNGPARTTHPVEVRLRDSIVVPVIGCPTRSFYG